MKQSFFIFFLLCALSACSSSDDDSESKDMTYPVISDANIVANPIDCQVYKRGEVIPFNYVFTDDTELGSFNIEIHNNFDHHTHGTSSVECPMEAEKKPQNPWIFNKDYSIPVGQRAYTARFDIAIPGDIDTGDYHFMIRVTDRAGWQQLRAMAIKVE